MQVLYEISGDIKLDVQIKICICIHKCMCMRGTMFDLVLNLPFRSEFHRWLLL